MIYFAEIVQSETVLDHCCLNCQLVAALYEFYCLHFCWLQQLRKTVSKLHQMMSLQAGANQCWVAGVPPITLPITCLIENQWVHSVELCLMGVPHSGHYLGWESGWLLAGGTLSPCLPDGAYLPTQYEHIGRWSDACSFHGCLHRNECLSPWLHLSSQL